MIIEWPFVGPIAKIFGPWYNRYRQTTFRWFIYYALVILPQKLYYVDEGDPICVFLLIDFTVEKKKPGA